MLNALVPDPVTHRPESPLRPRDVVVLADVAVSLERLRAAGFLLVGVSNQPAAAKGAISRDELAAVHARVLELVGVAFDDFRLCLHHPQGTVPELSGACDCRKPAPGMLLEAAAALDIDLAGSWMIGDTDADVRAGARAGCRTVLVEQPASAHKRGTGVTPDVVAGDLAGAASAILAAEALSSAR